MIKQLEYTYYKEYQGKFSTLLNMTVVSLYYIEHKEDHNVITFHGGFNGSEEFILILFANYLI